MSPSIIYLVINLESATERRESIISQAAEHGFTPQFIPAIAGGELTPDHLAHYDEAHLRRYYAYRLIPNEIACSFSHRKALRAFLESGAEYAVILEDDALLDVRFNEGIHLLTEQLSGWEVAKLQMDPGRLSPLPLAAQGSGLEPVYSRKIGCEITGMVYTRRAAQILYDGLERIWLPVDSQIYQLILDHPLPTIGLRPTLLFQPYGNSCIDPTLSVRSTTKQRRTLVQYLRHRTRILRNTLLKQKLYRKVLRCVRRTA